MILGMLRFLAIALASMLLVQQATAQQSKPNTTIQPREPPVVNELNLTLDASKMHFCFWNSAAYSPGSLVDFIDSSKNSSICFHCNADGTWDKPCQ
jgi:hypothetical protein